jgi:hypothetical protein
LQGIPLHELPPNRAAARIAIGNAINRTMMTFFRHDGGVTLHPPLPRPLQGRARHQRADNDGSRRALDQEPMEV